MKIRFHPEAEVELHEALQWYGRQRKGLEAEFMLCVDEALQRISRNPELYPVVHRNARRVIVRRFPFVVIYESRRARDQSSGGVSFATESRAMAFKTLA
jgi:hypothetical protein